MTDKTITLPEQDWMVIDQALSVMPYRQVNALYQKINEQLAAQLEPPSEEQAVPPHEYGSTPPPASDRRGGT